jgi:hypothetical protein
MNKAILVGLTILTVSTSAASAGTHRTHHARATTPNTSAAAMNPNTSARPMNAQAAVPTAAMPGVSGKDREMRMKNLHESGYDPKKDFTANKTMRQQ